MHSWDHIEQLPLLETLVSVRSCGGVGVYLESGGSVSVAVLGR